ncbi:MAG TPA: hypothetical protein VFY36_02590 [Solirubrobacteraceae bacterium]|nr:hypothetical protein [Solirubrobacteraceae bacterium]
MSTRKSAVADSLDALQAKRPAGHHPDEIVAMLDAVPDLRPVLTNASDGELVEIFRVFDLAITPELLPILPQRQRPPRGTVAD